MSTDNLHTFQRDPDTYAIIGAAMAVHSELGCGFNERVYREGLAIEFALRGIPFEREVRLTVAYKQHALPLTYRVDFVCRGVLIELKAVETLLPVHEAQLVNYLKASGLTRGLLLNFGAKSLGYIRKVHGYPD